MPLLGDLSCLFELALLLFKNSFKNSAAAEQALTFSYSFTLLPGVTYSKHEFARLDSLHVENA